MAARATSARACRLSHPFQGHASAGRRRRLAQRPPAAHERTPCRPPGAGSKGPLRAAGARRLRWAGGPRCRVASIARCRRLRATANGLGQWKAERPKGVRPADGMGPRPCAMRGSVAAMRRGAIGPDAPAGACPPRCRTQAGVTWGIGVRVGAHGKGTASPDAQDIDRACAGVGAGVGDRRARPEHHVNIYDVKFGISIGSDRAVCTKDGPGRPLSQLSTISIGMM
jgi:hypothetical protein